MKTPYVFSVLRYVHDIVSGEFINVGIVVYSSNDKKVLAKMSLNYSRISSIFNDVNGQHFRKVLKYIQDRFDVEGYNLLNKLEFERPPVSVVEFVAKILPLDDTSLQFSPEGFGVSDNLSKTLEQLYSRHVTKYLGQTEHRRNDDEVWRVYRQSLNKKGILKHLIPHKIVGKYYEHEFKHCFKNGSWHANEPLSFDFIDDNKLVEKANHWVGKITSLSDSSDKFKVNVLLGKPTDNRLNNAYIKAKNILHKMPCEKEFIEEDSVDDFANELAQLIKNRN